MNTTSTISSSTVDATPRSRSAFRVAAIGALTATVANLALWLGGRAADVSFPGEPARRSPDHAGRGRRGGPDHASHVRGRLGGPRAGRSAFAVGWAVLVLAARRSRRWVHIVMAAAAVVAVVSAAGPLSAAHDTATAALLAAMHLVTGAAFLAAAARVRTR
jgi:hypothetical protein